ncbi:MAG: protein kinase domain-containing protein [Bacteroidota bacterium]
MINTTISHYKILEKLGEGGMGIVYKAQDTKLDRIVALKFLPSHLSASEQDKARFIQEAKAASAINHPNICTIYSIDEHEGQLFIAMEFVDGQTLRDKRGSISAKQAIEIGTQIADGLAAAHDKGIVHRDIKPENIMVRKDGIAQIMDFGLAKLRGVSRLTKEGSTLGTAGYMSPELVQGQDADHRSDIFSFGVLLYELFTGQLPFRGVHETALMYEIVNVDAPPMSSVKPEVDPSLDAIVLECLEKDPNERTQSVKQVSIDLKRIKRESGRARVSRVTSVRPIIKSDRIDSGNPSEAPRWRRILWPVVSAILGLALLYTVWIFRQSPISRSVARFDIVVPKDQTLVLMNYPAIAISPDGTVIVYKANEQLYQRRLENLELEPIPGTEGGISPFFSPDSRWLGFFVQGKMMKVPLHGGSAVFLAELQGNRGGTWGKDGTIVFSPSGRGGLFRVKQDGGDVQRVTTADTTQNERTHRWPHFLPDGKTVIFTIGTFGSPDYYEDATIAVVNIETGERKTVLKGASSARFLPPGYIVYSHAGTLFAVSFDMDRLEVTGTAFPVLSNVSSDVTTGATNFSFADNGTLVYIPGSSNIGNRKLALLDLVGNMSTLSAPVQSYVDPCMSPDGKRIAVAVQSGRDFDIWVYDIQRNTMSRLTFGGSNRSPVWSPDSRRIAYSNNTAGPGGTSGRSRVVILQADGSGAQEEIPFLHDRTYLSCWSRDGSMLFGTVPQQGMGWDLWLIPLTGDRTPKVLLSTKFDEAFASLSPDGKWLAYLANETGSSQVYVRPFPQGSGKWQISVNGGNKVDWSEDGRTLYFGTPSEIMFVSIVGTHTLTTGQPQVLIRDYPWLNVESAISYDIAPDGKHILVAKPRDEEKLQQINVVMNWFDEINNTVASGK